MYFAKLDLNDVVIQVIVADQAFVDTLPGRWIQTDVQGISPKNYAGIGFSYDKTRNAFIPPKPHASWVLNDTTCQWDAPTPMPQDGKIYRWDESALAWI